MKKIAIVFIALFLINCNSSDDTNDNVFDAFVQADINGETIRFNFGENSLGAALTTSSFGSNTIYGFGIGASTDGVSDNTETTSIGLALILDNPDVIMAGATFNYPTDLLSGTYTYENSNTSTTIDGDGTVSATLTINAFDLDQEKMSGTFSYVTVDENTNTTYTVSNGVFSNIPYFIN
jgi:hypothetical protein